MVPLLLILAPLSLAFRLQPLQQTPATCGKYQCATSNLTFATGTCVQVVNNTNFIQPCEPFNTTYCNVTTMKCAPLSLPAVQPSWPGEACGNSQPCLYGSCQVGKCKSLGLNFPCSTSGQCDPGLYCNATGLCATQLGTGAGGCHSEYDCWNGAECNYTAVGTGVCVQFATVPRLGVVTDCSNGFSRMCKSGACRALETYAKTGVCVDPPISVSSLPVKCTAASDCVGSDGFNYYMSSCVCGFNANAQKYCQPFLGDTVGVTYITTWAAMLRDSNGVCNTMRRYDSACMAQMGIRAKVLQAEYSYLYYAQLQGNDDCIKKTYTRAYWADARALTAALALWWL